MHVCIVGTGAAGWISAYELNQLDEVKRITIIGSPHIPTIGVGESTTRNFYFALKRWFPTDNEFYSFLVDIDASVKYGVYYDNWGSKNFLHSFVGSQHTNMSGYLLGGLPKEEDVNYYITPFYDEIVKNHNYINGKVAHTYHFDANKFISSMEKRAAKFTKIEHIKNTVINANFNIETIQCLVLSDGTKIQADYYVNCVGHTAFNQKIFREEYIDYSNVLLTNKALFHPLKYSNKPKQFHPYTVAKTMKNGWRWITPTWSRIGTGYVYSSNHTTKEEAVAEFKAELGDNEIEPFETDFSPRRIKKTFKQNYCSLGMASGFLEPLDAPGLSLTIDYLDILKNQIRDLNSSKTISVETDNYYSENLFDFWTSFIVHQYRNCYRNDTKFWVDHKNISFEYYNKITDSLKNEKFIEMYSYSKDPTIACCEFNGVYIYEPWMFFHTLAGRGLRWPVKWNLFQHKTFSKIKNNNNIKIDKHLDWFDKIHKEYG